MKAVGMLLLAAIALVAVWTSSKLSARQEAGRVLAQAETALTRVESAKQAAHNAYAEQERQRAQLRREVAAAPASPATTASTPAAVEPNAEVKALSKMAAEDHAARKTPKGQLVDLAWRRANVGEANAAFYRSAGWSPERVRAYEDILMKREEGVADLQAVAAERGSSMEHPDFQKLSGALYLDYEKSARELLGGEDYTKLVNFGRTVSVRDLVGSVAGAALVEGVPLSAQQVERLVQALAETSESYRKGQTAMGIDFDWAAVELLLPGILSEQQLAFVRTMEAPGGGLFHIRWNAELVKATSAEAKARRSAGK